MYLIQITDQHVGLPGADSYDIDVWKNFSLILDAVAERQPELLVLTGDLCLDKGEVAVYERAKKDLDRLDIPYFMVSGNHDDPVLMAEVFDMAFHLSEEGRLYYRTTVGNRTALFMDSTPGNIDDAQLSWLDTQLELSSGPLLVFMHHPPIEMGIPWMDNNHALQNREEVANKFKAYGNSVDVFCGHFHNERTAREGQVAVHLTPSSYFQISPHQDTFKIDHLRIGYREIIVKDDALQHSVVYL